MHALPARRVVDPAQVHLRDPAAGVGHGAGQRQRLGQAAHQHDARARARLLGDEALPALGEGDDRDPGVAAAALDQRALERARRQRVVDHEVAVGGQGAAPPEQHLAVEQPVVDTDEDDAQAAPPPSGPAAGASSSCTEARPRASTWSASAAGLEARAVVQVVEHHRQVDAAEHAHRPGSAAHGRAQGGLRARAPGDVGEDDAARGPEGRDPFPHRGDERVAREVVVRQGLHALEGAGDRARGAEQRGPETAVGDQQGGHQRGRSRGSGHRVVHSMSSRTHARFWLLRFIISSR